MTVAPGTTAPLASVIVPKIVPLVVWAMAGGCTINATATAKRIPTRASIPREATLLPSAWSNQLYIEPPSISEAAAISRAQMAIVTGHESQRIRD